MDFSLDFTPTYRGPHGNYRKWCLIFIVVVQYTVPFLIRDVFVVGTQILRNLVGFFRTWDKYYTVVTSSKIDSSFERGFGVFSDHLLHNSNLAERDFT